MTQPTAQHLARRTPVIGRTLVCESCGCQQVTAIAELTREHDAVAALVGQIQNALSGQRGPEVVSSCQRLLTLLASHMVVEEEGLFAQLRHDYPEHIMALRSEHREIEQVLGEAAGGFPQDASWPDRLRDALCLFREHIRKEEDGVFPAAHVALDADQWERVESVRARVLAASRATGPTAPPARTMSPTRSRRATSSARAMSASGGNRA